MILLYALLGLAALLVITGLTSALRCMYLDTTPQMKSLYESDEAVGTQWKMYRNKRGDLRAYPARIDEKYLKEMYGAKRVPSLDFKVEE